MVIRVFFVFSVIVIATIASTSGVLSVPKFDATPRHNGFAWIQYGPAVISSAKFVSLSIHGANRDEFERYIVSDKDRSFKDVLGIILKRFGKYLNYSPRDIDYSPSYLTSLCLYTTSVNSEEEQLFVDCTKGQASVPKDKGPSPLLVEIPLVAVLGTEEIDSVSATLKGLMRRDAGAKNPMDRLETIEDALKRERLRFRTDKCGSKDTKPSNAK